MNENCVAVIDDDAASADSLVALLNSLHLTTESYESAEDFLADYENRDFDCLVIDIRLKGISGLELLETLVGREDTTPVILVSGHADYDSWRRAKECSAVACFEKPFRTDQFCQTVSRVVSAAGIR